MINEPIRAGLTTSNDGRFAELYVTAIFDGEGERYGVRRQTLAAIVEQALFTCGEVEQAMLAVAYQHIGRRRTGTRRATLDGRALKHTGNWLGGKIDYLQAATRVGAVDYAPMLVRAFGFALMHRGDYQRRAGGCRRLAGFGLVRTELIAPRQRGVSAVEIGPCRCTDGGLPGQVDHHDCLDRATGLPEPYRTTFARHVIAVQHDQAARRLVALADNHVGHVRAGWHCVALHLGIFIGWFPNKMRVGFGNGRCVPEPWRGHHHHES